MSRRRRRRKGVCYVHQDQPAAFRIVTKRDKSVYRDVCAACLSTFERETRQQQAEDEFEVVCL